MSHPAAASTPRRPRVWRYVAIALAILVSPVFALAATVAATGIVTVDVDPADGPRLYIPVPALLVDLAVFAAPRLAGGAELERARAELAPYRDGLAQMATALERCPDGVLVEVLSPREEVRVTKDGRSFRIDVRDRDVDVTVKVPARLLGRVLDVAG